MTNLKQKEVVSDATNKDFYNSFFTSTRITQIIGYFGQFISSLTEFHFIFSALNGSYSPFGQTSNILPLLGGLLAIYIFEYLGVRVYLVRIIRQIVNKDFGSWERKILFAFNMLFVLALCGANLVSSYLGQNMTFAAKTNVTTTDKTHHLELEKTAKVEAIQQRYDKQLQQLSDDYNKQVEAIENRYKTDIYNLKNNRFAARDNKAKYNSYTAKIDSKLSDKANELHELKQTYNRDKTDLQQGLNKDKTGIKQSFDNRINDISKVEQSNINSLLVVQKYTLPLLLGFILLSWFAIVYEQIFLVGSGQKIEVKQIEKRPLLIVVLITGIYEKIYQMFYYITARIVGTKKYQFGSIKQDVVKYDLSKIHIKKLHSDTHKIAAQYRQIGYNRNNQNTINNNDIVNISNVSKTNDLSDLKQTTDINNVQRYTVNVEAKKTVNKRHCKNCNKIFNYKHWNARYCSDKCRIESWEQRTGKKLKKKSKK